MDAEKAIIVSKIVGLIIGFLVWMIGLLWMYDTKVKMEFAPLWTALYILWAIGGLWLLLYIVL